MNKQTTSNVFLTMLLTVGMVGWAHADGQSFTATLSGDQEVVVDADGNFVPGGTETDATGRLTVSFDAGFTKVTVNLKVEGLVGAFGAAHLHCGLAGQNGPVAFGLNNPGPLDFDGQRIRGELTNADFSGGDCEPLVGRPINNIAALAFAMREGLIYVNVHTDAFPPGEIRGQLVAKK